MFKARTEGKPRAWWRVGLVWGAWMYIGNTIGLPYIIGEAVSTNRILIGIPAWIVAGLLFGLVSTKLVNTGSASGKSNGTSKGKSKNSIEGSTDVE